MSQAGIQYKPQIFKQGLVLVSIPLLVGSFVLLLMSQLWLSTEKSLLAEEQQTEILAHFNLAFNLWAQAAANLMARTFSEGEGYSKYAEEYSQRLRSEFFELKNLNAAAQKKGGSKNLKKLEALCLNSIDEFSSLPAGVSSDPMTNFHTLQKVPVLFHELYVMPGKIRVLLENEWSRLQTLRESKDEQSRNVKLLAYLCVFGNLILSMLLVWVFVRRITKRLQIVTENAGLLPKVQKLTLQLAGNDELAFLDAALHAASAKLSAAAEHRRTILGMVAHDMRSPLLAAQLCLEVLAELMNESYSEGTKADLESALAQIRGILEHVKALLTLEKNSVESASEDLPLTSAGKEQRLPFWPQVKKFSGDMFFNQKLFHKCLWLVLIPLLVQTAFLFLLSRQIAGTEKIVSEERTQCNIVMSANWVFLGAMKASIAESIYFISGSPSMKETVLRNHKNAVDGFGQLMEIAAGSPEWMSVMKDLKELTAEHLKQVALQNYSGSATMKEIVARFKQNKPMQQSVGAIYDRALLLFKQESLRIKDLQTEQIEARKKVTEILAWSVLANFLLALGMLVSFSNEIRHRVNLLVEDAARLGDPEPLNELIAGSDELAYLDLIFSHVQTELIQAASERAGVMNMLAQEMAAPLKQAQQSLRIFHEKEGSQLNERKLKQLSRAQSNIERVLDLINDLLTMETLETGKLTLERQTLDVQQVIDESIATVSSLALAKKIKIINQCQEKSLSADRARLIQMLVNLLTNAIKFSPQDSKITVASAEMADYWRISVADEGPGMDENIRSRVFDKFFQADGPQKQQGFGLGLAICRMIVESHGGQIGVDSQPGQGSTFWFELPFGT